MENNISSEEEFEKCILITNDDGYFAPGIHALGRELKKIARVVIVAPDRERSAVSHALTFFDPIRAWKVSEEENLTIYACSGTPTDCVILGTHHLIENKPGLVISGINRGSNMGDDITYSGTVAGAIEGTIQGINSIAVSLNSIEDFDSSFAARFTAKIADHVLKNNLPDGIFLNINFPAVESDEIRGVEITTQGRSIYKQKVIKRSDPKGRDYFWITGAHPRGEPIEGTDFWAVENNKISICPLSLSMTRIDYIDTLKEWDLYGYFSSSKNCHQSADSQ